MNMPPPPNIYGQPQFQQPKNDMTKYIWLGVGGCLCIVLMGVGLIAAFMFPQINRSREGLALGGCLENMRGLGMSLTMYGADNNEMMPPAATWMDAMKDRIASPTSKFVTTNSKKLDPYAALRCPGIAQLQDPDKYGYAYVDSLSTSGQGDPNLLPIIFDSTLLSWNAHGPLSTQPNPPRHSKNHFLFADGHVTSEGADLTPGSFGQ